MERVTFSNRGKQVVGNVFTPADANAGTAGPAIVVTHPFGAVKEQVSTLYAQLLTEQGFITLVFDAAYQGESGGEPHFTESPASRVEDIRCAVDFLTTRPEVDPERIGALGICAGGGYTLNAAQSEHRIKAVAGVSSFDIGSARRSGIGGTVSPERRREILHEVGQQRTLEAEGEPIRYYSLVRDDPTFDVTHPETLPALYRDGYLYYTQIAPNERAMTEFVFTTYAEQMAFFPFADIQSRLPAAAAADRRLRSGHALLQPGRLRTSSRAKRADDHRRRLAHRPVPQARVRTDRRHQADRLLPRAPVTPAPPKLVPVRGAPARRRQR